MNANCLLPKQNPEINTKQKIEKVRSLFTVFEEVGSANKFDNNNNKVG